MSNKHLSVCLLAESAQINLQDIAGQIARTGTSIIESRLTRMGNCTAWQLLAEGNWSALAKLETALSTLPAEISASYRRTDDVHSQSERVPYRIWISAADKPGIMNHLLQFLTEAQAQIEDMNGSVFPAPYTSLPAAKMELHISLSADKPISILREDFSNFCDAHNIDGVVESFS